jgi:hypothetical protein
MSERQARPAQASHKIKVVRGDEGVALARVRLVNQSYDVNADSSFFTAGLPSQIDDNPSIELAQSGTPYRLRSRP